MHGRGNQDHRQANQTGGEIRFQAKLCLYEGSDNFNRCQYQNAVNHYTRGVNLLASKDVLNDEDYRLIIDLSINLSDAFMHLSNIESANQAFENAIKAFKWISRKTADEQCIAKANDGYASFRAYYEKEVSTCHYLTSREFKNHDQMIHDKQAERQMETMLGDLVVSPEAAAERKLGVMMEELTFTSPSPFAPIAPVLELPDEHYRSMANQFIVLANKQYADQQVLDAMQTLQQASSTLEKVREKTLSDMTLLEQLRNNIKQLRDQVSARALSSPQALHGGSSFASPVAEPALQDDSSEDSMEVDFSW